MPNKDKCWKRIADISEAHGLSEHVIKFWNCQVTEVILLVTRHILQCRQNMNEKSK